MLLINLSVYTTIVDNFAFGWFWVCLSGENALFGYETAVSILINISLRLFMKTFVLENLMRAN